MMPTVPMPDAELGVRAALETLYVAFADAPRPRRLRGCPCCVSEAEACALLARPLRALLGDDLDRYAWKAVTTMGSADDLAYFVPRLLELLALDRLGADPEPVLAKLAYGYDEWSEPRRHAVDGLFEAVLARELARPRGDVDAWICGCALGTTDAAARLAAVLDAPGALAGLTRWADRNRDVTGALELRSGYWGPDDPGARALLAWLGRPEVSHALGKAGGGDGVFASERCLLTGLVDARGRVLLDVEFEVHPGAAGSLRIALSHAR